MSLSAEDVALLRRCPGLRRLDDTQFGRAAASAQRVRRNGGQTLVVVDGTVDSLSIVLDGRFEALDREGRPVGWLRPGDVIGELTLAADGPAAATVVSVGPSTTAELDMTTARTLLHDSPAAMADLTKVVVERMRRGRRADPAPELVGVAAGDDQARITELLEDSGVSVLDARRDPSPVDSLLVVGPPPERLPRARRRLHARRHRRDPTLDNTPSLLAGELTDEVLGRIRRLAVSGARVAVFSGGGQRGAAHLGAIECFLSRGWTFDATIGVSAGSLPALGLGFDQELDDLQAGAEDWMRGVLDVRDLGPTASSVLRGARFTAASKRFAGRRRLEDAHAPVTLVATDLATRRSAPIHSGSAWRSIRASASVPILFPPVRAGDQVLVDGCVSDNLPTWLAHDLYPEPEVVAFDVGTLRELLVDSFADEGIDHRRSLIRRKPVLGELVTYLTTPPQTADGPVALAIRPEVGSVPALGTRGFGDAVAIGRTTAEEVLAAVARDRTPS